MKCPICGTSNIVYGHLKFLCIDEIAPVKIDLFLCKCGFAYYRHNGINKLYNQNSKYTTSNTGSGAAQHFDVKRLQSSFQNISAYIHKDDFILDVGCNNGAFLNILYENGFKHLSGTDFSINRTYTAALEAKDVKIYQAASLKEIPIEGLFDIITANHVLEHVDNIDYFIIETKDGLKENGLIYIEVPDASRYYEQYFQPFSYFDLEHINHFNLDSLSILLRKYGFDVLESFISNANMSESIQYPILGIVARKNKVLSKTDEILIPENANESIKRFYERSMAEIQNHSFHGAFDNVVIYGVGANTLRTLGMLGINIDNIKYFVDKNTLFHNRSILNKEIKNINDLAKDESHPNVIIFSKLYFDEIIKELKEKGIDNNTYSFF